MLQWQHRTTEGGCPAPQGAANAKPKPKFSFCQSVALYTKKVPEQHKHYGGKRLLLPAHTTTKKLPNSGPARSTQHAAQHGVHSLG